MTELTIEVDCGCGAFMSIADPRSFEVGGVEWRLRYGNPEQVRFAAATLVESYDYLLSGEITQKEAERRLRLMRQVRRATLKQAEAVP